MADRMTPLDAAFLDLEDEDAHVSMAISSVAILDGPAPSQEELAAALLARLPLVPRYRQKVRQVPLDLGRPVWVDDPAFDPTMCATISGNTTAANAPTPGGNTFPGIDLFKRSTVAAEYQFGIVGLTPSPSTNANTESFVSGLNPNASVGGGFYAGRRVAVDAGNNFVSCTHPAGF